MVDNYNGQEPTSILFTNAIYNIPQLEKIAKESMIKIVDAIEDHKESWDKTCF